MLLSMAMHDLSSVAHTAERRLAAMRLALREAMLLGDRDAIAWLRAHGTEYTAVATQQQYETLVAPLLWQRLDSPAHVSGVLSLQPRAVVAANVDALLRRAVEEDQASASLFDALIVEHGARVSRDDYAVLRLVVTRNDMPALRNLLRLLVWEAHREPSAGHQAALHRELRYALNDERVAVARELSDALAALPPLPVVAPQVEAAPAAAPAAAAPMAAAAQVAESSDTEDEDEEHGDDVIRDIRAHYCASPDNRVPLWRVHMFVANTLRKHNRLFSDDACAAAMESALHLKPVSGKRLGSATYAVRVAKRGRDDE